MMNTKIKRLISLPRFLALASLGALIAVSMQHPLSAQTVTQGYSSDQPLQRGIIVRIKENDGTKVEPASQSAIDKMHGVVVDANDAPVTLSNDGSKVFVATTGHFDMLVSNQAGPINAGDYITISALDGVGMKSGVSEPVVVGRALASFDGKAGTVSNSEIKDSTGKQIPVGIARISVDIAVSRNPNLKAAEPNLPEFLERASTAIAGKKVNPVRVYTGLLIFSVSAFVATSLMYGGVRSGIISIGRNPLSKKSIVRGMIQVVIVGLTIFISGILGVYLLLKI